MKKDSNKRYRQRQNERGILRVELCLPVDVVKKMDEQAAAQGLSPAGWVKILIERSGCH